MALYAVGAGAATYATAKEVFAYNRENFHYDKEQRQKSELHIISWRLAQAGLWREDIRDVVGLTSKKMDKYMEVNCLQLTFAVILFTEGRLLGGTPQWLLWLYNLSTASTFLFLLMCVWFAMHASVVAHANSTRLLTQIVRLPIPSWETLEATRTYGAAFEGLPLQQMLRVPLLKTALEGSTKRAGAGGASGDPGAHPGTTASDPWGLERRGDDIYELGRRPISQNRHIQLIRQAMEQYQAYDCFARVAMTLGTIQMCSAISGYVLGYALIQDASLWGACCSVILFTSIASFIMWCDLSMTLTEYIIAQTLLALGPLVETAAAAWWSTYTQKFQGQFEILIMVAYLTHAFFLLFFLQLCHVVKQPSGCMIPTGFRSVLYLDVFGWLTHEWKLKRDEKTDYQPVTCCCESELVKYGKSHVNESDSDSDDGGPSKKGRAKGDQKKRRAKLNMVHSQTFPRHTASMDPKATMRAVRPEDVDMAALADKDRSGINPGHHQAYTESQQALMGNLHGATPKSIPGVGTPGTIPNGTQDTFKPSTYGPAPEEEDDHSFETGHDYYVAGQLPWYVFRAAVLILVNVWLVAAGWAWGQFLDFPDIPDKVMPETVSEITKSTSLEDRGHSKRPPLLETGERVFINWPNERFQPVGLSCDPEGQEFAIADEFQLYFGSIQRPSALNLQAMKLVMGKEKSVDGLSSAAPRFAIENLRRAPRCVPLEGEAIRDVALLRVSGDKQSVFVLHSQGKKLAECFLEKAIEAENTVWNITTNWLRPAEHICTVAVDADCDPVVAPGDPVDSAASSVLPGAGGPHQSCVVVGTDKGRMVKTRNHRDISHLLVASASLYEDADMALDSPQSTTASTIQILPSGHLLILRDGCDDKCKIIQAVDKDAVQVLGEWRLPRRRGRTWAALTGDRAYVYLVSLNKEGHEAELWRFPLPSILAS